MTNVNCCYFMRILSIDFFLSKTISKNYISISNNKPYVLQNVQIEISELLCQNLHK